MFTQRSVRGFITKGNASNPFDQPEASPVSLYKRPKQHKNKNAECQDYKNDNNYDDHENGDYDDDDGSFDEDNAIITKNNDYKNIHE